VNGAPDALGRTLDAPSLTPDAPLLAPDFPLLTPEAPFLTPDAPPMAVGEKDRQRSHGILFDPDRILLRCKV
jgi:hypothetical protein